MMSFCIVSTSLLADYVKKNQHLNDVLQTTTQKGTYAGAVQRVF